MFRNLRAEMARDGLSTNVLAKKIGITGKTLGIKLHGEREFTRKEMFKIQEVLTKDLTLESLFEWEDTKNKL